MYRHVHAVGDSHVLHMGGLFNAHHFCDSEGQGATAHNLISEESSTDSRRKLAALLDTLDPAKDIIIMSFGEVDCRLHIQNDDMAIATVERYTQAVENVRTRGFRVIVHAVIIRWIQEQHGEFPFMDFRCAQLMVGTAQRMVETVARNRRALAVQFDPVGLQSPQLR